MNMNLKKISERLAYLREEYAYAIGRINMLEGAIQECLLCRDELEKGQQPAERPRPPRLDA
jgi:hypothetical protein